jgi:hypothetical protein
MAFILRASASRPTTANTPSLAVGDIWIQPNGVREQLQSMAPDVWVPMPVDPGLLPPGGALTQRLAKAGAAFGLSMWSNAAEAMVFTHTQGSASLVWNVEHRLAAQYVHVLAIDISRANTVMIPDIAYPDTMNCHLTFARPVSGMALVRR